MITPLDASNDAVALSPEPAGTVTTTWAPWGPDGSASLKTQR